MWSAFDTQSCILTWTGPVSRALRPRVQSGPRGQHGRSGSDPQPMFEVRSAFEKYGRVSERRGNRVSATWLLPTELTAELRPECRTEV